MSGPGQSELEGEAGAVDRSSSPAPSLTTITALDTALSSHPATAQPAHLALLAGQEEEVEGDGGQQGRARLHDLAPVHRVLVQHASSLQTKVDLATRELKDIMARLATEMLSTADSLAGLGEVKLPSGFPVSSSGLLVVDSPATATIAAIHRTRDGAVAALRAQAASLLRADTRQAGLQQAASLPEDFNTASDLLDSSFQQLRGWLDQVGQAAKKLQSCDGEAGTLRRFSSEKCRDIDLLEREAVLHKMGELSVRNCSLQSRKPVRSLGHTLDLQEIMLLAKNAKSLVYEVSLQMLKIVDLVKGEEIACTGTYHRLTKENSELLRRYCFYLKLKIQQL